MYFIKCTYQIVKVTISINNLPSDIPPIIALLFTTQIDIKGNIKIYREFNMCSIIVRYSEITIWCSL